MLMRIAIWTYTAAVALASAAAWLLAALFERVVFYQQGGRPLPAWTSLAVHWHWAFLVVPLPFVIAAIGLSRSDETTPARVLSFAAFSTLAIVLLFSFLALSVMLPFVPLITPLR